MSEYWKSLPRKYCDTCKCWFADNRASIEFHEKGKRHQENVEKRINQIQKKGLKEYKAKLELEDEMKKIEKAALEAFKKDIKENPDLTAKSIVNSTVVTKSTVVKTEPKPVKKEPVSKPTPSVVRPSKVPEPAPAGKPAKIWYEGVSEEGYTYYWNSETSESTWEPPEEGFISLQEQNELYTATVSEDVEGQEVKEEISGKSEDKSEEDSSEDAEDLPSSMGPQVKPDPYGQWVTVEKKVEPKIDWELPVQEETGVEVHIPVPKEDSFKIKEKTVGHLTEDYGKGESTFKKRKNLGSMKRNVRQRVDDS